MASRAWIAVAAACAACASPSLEECSVHCGAGGACPSGSVCRAGYCTAGDEVCPAPAPPPAACAQQAAAGGVSCWGANQAAQLAAYPALLPMSTEPRPVVFECP